jgi:hypothetical protein
MLGLWGALVYDGERSAPQLDLHALRRKHENKTQFGSVDVDA